MKGFVINDKQVIIKILEDIKEVNEVERYIKFGRSGQLSGINFLKQKIIVTDLLDNMRLGDVFPDDVEDKRAKFFHLSVDELIEQLQQENATLLLRLVEKGVI